jgi:Cytochrome b562
MTIRFKPFCTLALAVAAGMCMAVADDDTPLSKEMSAMNKTLRSLKRQAAAPDKKAENLELIAKMKTNVEASLKYEPAKTKDQPAADKPKYLESYKAQMTELNKSLDALKAAIEKGDAAGIQAIFDKLGDIKEKGHKDFAPDE